MALSGWGWDPEDTIVAVATPRGRGAIGIVRVSGPQAFVVAGHLFRVRRGAEWQIPTVLSAPRRCILRGSVIDPADGQPIDDALLLLLPSPQSYTGEDTAEFHCHGAPVVLDAVVSSCVAAGARLAAPGEFSLRAYRNDKFDLTQAEAVLNLVNAETVAAAKLAASQVGGRLSALLGDQIVLTREIAAGLEAAIDFPEDEVAAPERAAIGASLGKLHEAVSGLVASARVGRARAHGIVATIAGPANAGKSTLFNALLGVERAIVTPEPGTTRDVVEARLDMDGVAVTLRDTAGLRVPHTQAEAVGLQMASEAARSADILLVVVDAGAITPDGPAAQLAAVCAALSPDRTGDTILVLNKSDLVDGAHLALLIDAAATLALPGGAVTTAAVFGTGLAELRQAILRRALGDGTGATASAVLTTTRQEHAVCAASAALSAAVAALREDVPDDLLLIHLYSALEALHAARGDFSANVRADVVAEVFSRFCVGK